MNKLITMLRKPENLLLALGVFILLLVVGSITIGLPVHYANARRRLEPEVTITPKNTFEKTIRVVGNKDYRPFSYFKDSAIPRGYDIELVTELLNRMGYNIELKLVTWHEAVKALQEDKADMILGCDGQVSSVMDCNFTIPTFEEKFVIFQKEPVQSFGNMYSKKIAVIEGCGLMDTLKKYQLWKNCVEYPDVTNCVRAVIEKECDCFLVHHTIGEVSLRELGDKGMQFRGRMPFANAQMCFGISKNNADLYSTVNATLLKIRADGTMDELEEKWLERFGSDVSVLDFLRNHPTIVIATTSFLTIVILTILVMNYYLIRIRKEKNRAIAAEQAKILFFSTVSHDIRTPLNAIIGFSELLKHGIEDEAERKSALDAITTSSNTLLELVNDVLNLSKLETNKMVFTYELTNIIKLATSVLHSFDITANSKKVKLVEDFEPLPLLRVDPHRIRQILFNLIGNGVKFTEKGEVRLKITLDRPGNTTNGEGTLTLAVSDTGCGITPENQKKLMQPFVQLETPESQNGTGLGLYICRQLVEKMGGKLTLSSVFGKGSTFTVTIPNVSFSYQATETIIKESKPISDELKSLRVMIVDDVKINRLVTQAMLKKLNITNVKFASNGLEALKTLHDSPDGFDIILTDLWMPGMDGKTLVGEIRKNEQWKTLPVYAVTADTEAQESISSFGFSGILMKPITLEKLRELLP